MVTFNEQIRKEGEKGIDELKNVSNIKKQKEYLKGEQFMKKI